MASLTSLSPHGGRWLAVLGVLLCALFAPRRAHATDVPTLRAHVNDLAEVLDPSTRTALESKLKTHEEATGQQFALLTLPSLAGEPIEDFSIRVVEAWKIGRREEDDGLLMVVAVDDRKMRIEVGHGLEGAITDVFSGRLIRDLLGPAFKRGDYAESIDQAFDLLMAKARGESVSPPPRRARGGDAGSLLSLVVFVVIIVLIFSSFGGGGRRRRRGGGLWIGGLGGGFGGGGFGGGGGWGGGGGGGGGGGFSGGGGSFGGGGASGDW
jgi:uncharacterized protein